MVIKRKRYPRPQRSYARALQALRKVSRIRHIHQDESIIRQGQPAFTALPPKGLRVAVWNLAKGMTTYPFVQEFRRLSYQSDLFLTQEALLTDELRTLFRQPGYEFVHSGAYSRSDGVRDGVMTISRCHSLDYYRILSKGREPLFRTPKSSLVTEYPVEGCDENLLVINIHATLIRSIAKARSELEHIGQHIKSHSGPILFGGDFNTFTQQYLDGVILELEKWGLSHVELDNDPRHRLDCLDQLFVRGLEVSVARVDIHAKGSDHFPLYAVVHCKG